MRNEVGRGVTEMDAAGDTEDTVQGSKSAEGVEGLKTQRNGARSEVRAESRADETGLSESQITESQAESQKMQAQKMQTGETALDGSARSIVVLVVVGPGKVPGKLPGWRPLVATRGVWAQRRALAGRDLMAAKS